MTIEQIKSELGQLGLHERQDIAYWLLHQNAAPSQPGIVSTEDVCGGEARIAGTRIPVWVIAALRGQGLENPAIAKAYPTLRAGDVENALRYADSHREEIERAIAANEALCPMALLMADEDFPFPCVVELRALGHDVITSSEARLKDQSTPDNAVLVAAIATGRAVLTHNRRHFMRLHLDMPAHAGIIVCTVDGDFIALASRIHAAMQLVADTSGQLLRVYRPSK